MREMHSSEVRGNFAEVIRMVVESGEDVTVNRYNAPAVVMVSAEKWAAMKARQDTGK